MKENAPENLNIILSRATFFTTGKPIPHQPPKTTMNIAVIRHTTDIATLIGSHTTPNIIYGDVYFEGYDRLINIGLSKWNDKLVEQVQN